MQKGLQAKLAADFNTSRTDGQVSMNCIGDSE